MDTSKLKENIIRAFAGVPAPETPLINHECEECFQLQEAFVGKSWNDVSSELIREHFSNLPLFSPQAFHAFIPAYLIYSVENFHNDDMVSEFAAYALLPDKLAIDDEGHGNWWKLKLSLFSDDQFVVLLEYFDLVARMDEYFDQTLMKRGRERLIKLRSESTNQ